MVVLEAVLVEGVLAAHADCVPGRPCGADAKAAGLKAGYFYVLGRFGGVDGGVFFRLLFADLIDY